RISSTRRIRSPVGPTDARSTANHINACASPRERARALKPSSTRPFAPWFPRCPLIPLPSSCIITRTHARSTSRPHVTFSPRPLSSFLIVLSYLRPLNP
ncbi:hypothetical protein HETIRDRAFT_157811, partial [Heterobasidion irregulare TC 32-1]